MERKALSLFLALVMAFLFIPVMPVTVAEAATGNTATSGVTFAANPNTINLKAPTNIVFTANPPTTLGSEGYTFAHIKFTKPPITIGVELYPVGGGGYYEIADLNYNETNGKLTVPATVFAMHSREQGNPLPSGNYTAAITFTKTGEADAVYYVNFTMTTAAASSSISSSSSGKVAAVVESLWLERNEAQQLASKAKAQSDQSVRTIRVGTYGVRGNAWDRLTELRYYHDTKIASELQVRLYIDEPWKMKKDALVSAYTTGGWVEITKSKFEKHFTNKLQVVHFDQQTDWEQSVRVAAKLDFTGMETQNLHFYAFDKKSNTYRRIDQPAYRIDKNGYLHFTTPFAGDIIISENVLERK